MSKCNEQIQSAINDIAVIKQTLEKSKAHLGMLSDLFLGIGVIQLTLYIVRKLGLFYFMSSGNDEGINILQFAGYLTLGIVFVFYIKKRNEVKTTNNIISLQLFNLWGIVLFVLPLLRLVIVPFYFLANNDNSLFLFAFSFSDIITYGAAIMGILITGILINKKILTIGSVLLLAAYPLLYLCNGITNITEITTISIYGSFANVNTYAKIILMIAYIILGSYFKMQNGDKHGVE